MAIRAVAAVLTGSAIIIACSQAFAQDNDPAGDPAAAAEPDIATLIQDLDANRFSKRQDASRKLKDLGQPAIAALTEAALGASREASSRSFEILKDHFASGDDKLKEAAKAALQKLSASDKAPIAHKAKDVLDPKPPQPAQPMNPFGRAQIQMNFRIGGAQRVQMKEVNGVKDIDIKEQDRSIKIHEDPNKGITVEITEKKDGKDVKQKYEAKDAAELKKKHPEAHKLYEKYNKGGAIQIRGIQVQGMQMNPLQRGIQVPGRRLIDAKPIAQQLEKISAQVEEAHKLLEQLKSNPQETESLPKAIEQLEKAKKELQEARAKTG